MEMAGATLVALTLVCGTLTSASGRDQYAATEERPDGVQFMLNPMTADANDINDIVPPPHRFHVHTNRDRNDDKRTNAPSTVPELQIGCEKGLIRTRRKRSSGYDNLIERRNYNSPWSGDGGGAGNLLRPPMYQITRPYLIPIWGPPGRIPIFFPPQPIPYNPGYPFANPPNALEPPYSPPNNGYLPPASPTTSKPAATTIDFINKFDDEPPIWGDGEAAPTTTPSAASPAGSPTRRPRPNRPTSTHPPLVHSVNNRAGAPNNLSPTRAPSRTTTTTSTTYRPFAFDQTQSPFTSRPPPAPQRPHQLPTRSPSTVVQQRQRPISSCVWAIVQCCSGTSTAYSGRCFEERNCAGAFWDASPCESDFAKAAVATASQYYLGNNGR